MSKPELMSGKIDLSKVVEEYVFKGKNGARYLDIMLVPSPNSQYGDSHFISQGVSKELRLQGVRGPIIGNIKPWVKKGPKNDPAPARNQPTERQQANQSDDDGEEVPF